MAKRKSKKNSDAKASGYSVELTGLLLVLIGFIGFGFGIVGSLIKKFAMFLVGIWWMLLLLFVILIGLYMLIKRRLPKFISARLIGLYVVFGVILVASHFGFINNCETPKDIITITLNQYMERIDTISSSTALLTSGTSTIEIGGGMIGASLSTGLSLLFGDTGTKIITIGMLLFGFILLFDIKLDTLLSSWRNKLRLPKRTKKEPELTERKFNVDTLEYEKEEKPKEDKIVITSVEELKINNNKETLDDDHPKTLQDEQEYILPSLTLLDNPILNKKNNSNDFTKSSKELLENVLSDFGISGKVVAIHIGPAVTQYELVVPNGTKVSKILSINKEIALALAAKDVRIQAPIPGKNTIGIEIPNPQISMVKVKEILGADFKGKDGKIVAALGKDIMGTPKVMDIAKTPHLLIAGATGSGKSVCINTILASILMRYRPNEVKLVLVDPKKVELSNYNGVPHLMTPVVTDPKKASIALQKIVGEMERRYNKFEETGVKNITTYNEMIQKGNKKHPERIDPIMPYIVVIIDELADLMLVASKEVEDSIMRITQMARAAGIHLIVATQRPSTDVITGVVKSNIPSRISFAVSSNIDSRTILDMGGAEKLLGKGDMLYLPMGENSPIRIQGCYISDDEIKRIIDYCVSAQKAKYDDTLFSQDVSNNGYGKNNEPEEYDDPMYNEVVEFAIQTGKISASLLQRRFRFGYNRAARIVDLLEERGIIGPATGTSKPREVLVKLKEDENE